ncbi:MAG: hypothetical protein JW852_12260 [Spirochaetales bacterium]|nr:hypothetical protein [Spirochaetales bacterium]
MKRTSLFIAAAIALAGITGCSMIDSKGEVYISVEMVGGDLFTVKFLEPPDNEGSYTNEFSDSTGTTSAAGYTWRMYEVAAGAYDAYIEWTEGGAFGNGRARITIDPDSASNIWAAVYADTGGNVWAEQGGGTFSPALLFYP